MKVRSISRRRGTLVPLLAISCVALFAFVALAIDLGMLTVARTECQNAADTAALAGTRILNNKPTATDNDRVAAEAAATATLKENYLYNAKYKDVHITSVKTGVYYYDTTLTPNRFTIKYTKAANESWTAMEVVVEAKDQDTFFARVGNSTAMGITKMSTGAPALAVHRPRDIALVLDFTGSMGYGSTLGWPYSSSGGSTVEGTMNPDSAYPKFSHYARYTYYQTNTPSGQGSATVGSRPNPLRMKGFNGDFAPNNVTMETGGGPPIVEDFLTAPGDPSSVNNATVFENAFKRWSPALVTRADTATLTPAVYDYSGYDAALGATPAPDSFDTQSDSPVAYVGDKWPRTDGNVGPDTAAGWQWSTLAGSTWTDYGAKRGSEFLYPSGTIPTTSAAGRSLGSVNYTFPTSETGYQHPDTTKKEGGTTNAMYRDYGWEAYGYDLDVAALRAQTTFPKTVTLRPAAQRLKGYSMGPGYYGKTFFTWPPDPRWGGGTGAANPASLETTGQFAGVKDTNGNWVCDWRRRFFLRGDGAQFNPQTDNINKILFKTTNGHVLADVTATVGGTGAGDTAGYYRINYAAVIAWLKSGPQVLPTNLRAGRILYYSSMPNDLLTGSTGTAEDKTFLRSYIHYVLGVAQYDGTNAPIPGWNYTPANMLAGIESRFPFDTNSTRQITTTTAFTPTGEPGPNPKPYMDYTDEVNRPRQHFWFGPMTMTNFLERGGENRPWWSGTVHESQCWQLKAAINSVLDDIRNNHPNDFVGQSFFANRDHFSKPMAPMSQDWFTLRNVLFFRNDTVATLKATPNSTIEHRPYDANMASFETEKIPNGSSSTDPASGLSIAFNLLSSSTALPAADYGTRGRRGAAKIVIFETDGIPNTTRNYSITGAGVDTRYQASGSVQYWTGDAGINSHAQAAVKVIERIVAPSTTTGTSGFSTNSTPARVYAIAFGDLFDGYDGTNYSSLGTTAQGALRFLLRAQQIGKTSGPGDPPTAGLPIEQVITGPYQRPDPTLPENTTTNPPGRIEKLRTSLERIMQSGVQVTLVE